MLRMFQAHPGGLVGVAILLLRGSAALTLLSMAGSAAEDGSISAAFSGIMAVALLIGIGTRPAAALAAAGAIVTLGAAAWADIAGHLAFALEASSILLTGPGAFSIDAVRFGRTTLRSDDEPPTKV